MSKRLLMAAVVVAAGLSVSTAWAQCGCETYAPAAYTSYYAPSVAYYAPSVPYVSYYAPTYTGYYAAPQVSYYAPYRAYYAAPYVGYYYGPRWRAWRWGW